MPSCSASAGTMASLHCDGSKKKPSSLRATSTSSMVATAICVPSMRPSGDLVFAGGRHVRCDAGDGVTRQQRVPVEPLEHQLAQVVQVRFLQQRQANPGGKVTGQRLGVVVEVDEHRFSESGLDEAVGVAVVAGVERLTVEESADVLGEHLALEVG